MLQEAEEILERRVRPYLRSHGGDVSIRACSGRVLTVELTGECSVCPSASLSTRQMIFDSIHHELPEIESVELYAPVNEEDLELARRILRHDDPSTI